MSYTLLLHHGYYRFIVWRCAFRQRFRGRIWESRNPRQYISYQNVIRKKKNAFLERTLAALCFLKTNVLFFRSSTVLILPCTLCIIFMYVNCHIFLHIFLILDASLRYMYCAISCMINIHFSIHVKLKIFYIILANLIWQFVSKICLFNLYIWKLYNHLQKSKILSFKKTSTIPS